MTLLFIRVFFLILSTVVGTFIGSFNQSGVLGSAIGAGCGFLLILIEMSSRRVSVRGLSSVVFGLLLGVFMANLIADIISLLPLEVHVHSLMRVILTLCFSYLGAVMALRGKDEFNLIIPYVRFKRQDAKESVILLDTSVIIDGRISDIFKSNFLRGRLVVPRFVLEELQKLADSKDAIKRQRGRRGLDIMGLMQKDPGIELTVHEDDFLQDSGVDAKLITLAKTVDARLCTIDYNLNRVATIQRINVLNINELVNAVKVVLFQDEELEIRLIKEGKESGQAIGYTDDGTMVIVSDARKLIGQKRKVKVSSVLQTQAGRLVFAKLLK